MKAYKAKDSTVNLCGHCMSNYPDCNGGHIEFGNGYGNDNIVECDVFQSDGTLGIEHIEIIQV